MRHNLRKIIGTAALSLTVLTSTVPTWAGAVLQEEVTIVSNRNNGLTARGSLVGSHNSADPTKRIGCALYAQSGTVQAACDARIGDTLFQCVSSDAKVISAVQSMTDSSTIYFETRDGSNSCYLVLISDDSRALK